MDCPLIVNGIKAMLIMPTSDVRTFSQMRHRPMTQAIQMLWVVIIVFVPVVGALAFLLVRPGQPQKS